MGLINFIQGIISLIALICFFILVSDTSKIYKGLKSMHSEQKKQTEYLKFLVEKEGFKQPEKIK